MVSPMTDLSQREHLTLTFPVVAHVINVVRRDGVKPGLVKAADVAHATGLTLSHDKHDEWLTFEQVRDLLKVDDKLSHARFLAWLRPRLGASARRAPLKPTTWGPQPLRAVMTKKKLTVGDVTKLVNETKLEHVPVGNVGAAAVGAALPRAELIDRLVARLGGQPATYFTDAVLEAVEDRETKRALRQKHEKARQEKRAKRETTT